MLRDIHYFGIFKYGEQISNTGEIFDVDFGVSKQHHNGAGYCHTKAYLLYVSFLKVKAHSSTGRIYTYIFNACLH